MDVGKLCLLVILSQFGIFFAEGSEGDCSAFCAQPATGPTCNNVTGDCLDGCQPGYGGSKCNIQCCSYCKDCSITQGSVTAIECSECVKDYYQSDGDCKPCSENCARNESSSLSVCRQTDGRCEFGCQPGYYGDTCMSQCSSTCLGNTCSAVDGTCSSGCVLPVLTGSKCMASCSEGCVKRECSQTGSCLNSCTPHFWDTDCQNPCSPNCFRPVDLDTRVCNETTGYCMHGCVNSTYWDSNCSTECSRNCANQKCDYLTGDCMDGCVDEFEGPKCAERIKADNTVRTIAIGAGVGGLVVIIIIVVVVIACWRRKRNKF
ncbi:protein draper-like [Mercenaria mercenaria]|uniref:protein draper-like n=1 Tax=Mercenaria mercenaria TaxID=6596 RepID=UPI00234EF6A9|nr:protein draper-like [Mercenaria mercenaria]